MNGKAIYFKRKLRELGDRLFGGWSLKNVLLTGTHDPNCLLSRLLPGWAAVTARVIGWISLPFYPLFCLFVMDYMNYRKLDKLQHYLEEFPAHFRFECLVVLVLFGLLLLLLRRGAAAAGVMGALSLICGYVNYMKVSLNGDYFHPRDISMVTQAGDLVGFMSGSVPKWFFIGAAVLAVWALYLALAGTNLPLRWTVRWPALAVCAAMIVSGFSTSEKSNAILGKYGMTFFDAALQSSNYTANGFVGAFTINVLMAADVRQPEGYTQEQVEALMEGYRGTETAGPEYDVIVVLSESFFDARTLPGVSFSENPLPRYDELLTREDVYSGYIYTTAAGGGTVRPEFEILTGLSSDYLHDAASPYELVDDYVESFVSNYRDAGYRTVAIHPYNKKFYRRSVAYPYLGFDEFLGQEDVEALVETEYKRGLVSDDTTLRAIEYELEHAEGPVFIEAITMQNHQPFNRLPEEDIQIRVTSDALDRDTLDAVTTYTQGLADADKMLGDLADYIAGRERPTLVLFYGDHIPTLGNVYEETGFYGEEGTPQRLQKRYSTPFVMVTNTGAVSSLLKEHQDNRISTYYLLEIAAEMTGFRQTPYMRLLADWFPRVPAYNLRIGFEVTEDIAAFARMQELITYDRLMGRRWSVAGG